MGLIQREIEGRGIPTISVTLSREMTERVNPPRAIFAHFPLGHPMGRRDDVEMQRQMLFETLSALETIEEPGTIVESSLHFEGEVCVVCETNSMTPKR